MTPSEEALAWLRAQRRVRTKAAVLASAWGCSKSTVSQRLKRWSAEGLIKVNSGPKGVTVEWIFAAEDEASAAESPCRALALAESGEPPEEDWSVQLDLLGSAPTRYVSVRVAARVRTREERPAASIASTFSPPVRMVEEAPFEAPVPVAPPAPSIQTPALIPQPSAQALVAAQEPNPEPPPPPQKPSATPYPHHSRRGFSMPALSEMRIGDGLLVMVIVGLTSVMLYVSIELNAWYAESRGASEEAKQLWISAAITAEIFEAVMALAAARLSYRAQWGAAMLAYGVCVVIMIFAILAAVGFASTNVADSNAARGAIVEQRKGLESMIEDRRAELERLDFARSLGALDAALQQAQPLVASAVWQATKGCSDVTARRSGEACAEVLRLREERARAERRELLDREIAEARTRLVALPAVTAADPQAEAAATIANWITHGAANVTVPDVQLLFLVLVVLIVRLPVSVGPIVAVALWRPVKAAA